MEVLKETFEEILPSFSAAVQSADFISIDTELTGLTRNGIDERESISDTIQNRYNKIRRASFEFLITQFGVCTFTWSHDLNAFVARPFNFYVFPGGDKFFTCSASSLSFLSGYNFDFNKWIRSGIPCMNLDEEDRYIEKQKYNAEREPIPINDTNRDFLDITFHLIDEWLQNSDSSKKEITVSAINSYFRRLVYQETAARYNGFVIVKKVVGSEMTLEKLTEEEKKLSTSKPRMPLNFRSVIELIVGAKVPLIGHNCFLDLVFTFTQFWRTPSREVEEWKEFMTGLFETIIDTKHLAVSHPKLNIINTSLGAIFETVSLEPFSSMGPKIVFDPKFDRYPSTVDHPSSQGNLHEAGYDAYITGFVFLRMAEFIHNTSSVESSNLSLSSKTPSKEVSQTYYTSQHLLPFYNKIHLMRSEIPFIDLHGKEEIDRSAHFFLTHVPLAYNNANIRTLFNDLEPITISWMDNNTVLLIIRDPSKAKLLPEGKLGAEYLLQKGDAASAAAQIHVESWATWQKRAKGNLTPQLPQRNLGLAPMELEVQPTPKRKAVNYEGLDIPFGDCDTLAAAPNVAAASEAAEEGEIENRPTKRQRVE